MRIVKYKNRKMYNNSTSSYVKLEEIRDYVLNGQEFFVVDFETKEDITKAIVAKTLALVINSGDLQMSETMMKAQIIANVVDTKQETNYTNEQAH